MTAHLQRGILLYQQHRPEMAEEPLRMALAEDPDDSHAHAILALCLAERKQFDEAEREARLAVLHGLEFAFGYYALASVLDGRNRIDDAAAAIREAIRLDPEDADYHAKLASLHLRKRHWPDALASAANGLRFDPDHIACNNLRAIALTNLGRKDEAGQTMDRALARNPDNAVTQANQGWTYLHRGDRKQALEHFREALRIDPTNEWARAGAVEALKAGNPLYGMMLRYFLWSSRLGGQTRGWFIVGLWLGNRMLHGLGKSVPSLEPWVLPINIAYLAFCVLTWLAAPFFNLMLRLNHYGRHLLSDEQVRASNWIGAALLGILLCLGGWAATRFASWDFVIGAVFFAGMLFPLAGIFQCRVGWPRNAMIVYASLVAAIGLATAAVVIVPGGAGLSADDRLAVTLGSTFGLASVLSTWVSSFLGSRQPVR